MTTTVVAPFQARAHALHYATHVSDGWDGYSMDDVAEYVSSWMEDFLTGGLTFEADIKPLCDEWCT